jgi:hypothetical protein
MRVKDVLLVLSFYLVSIGCEKQNKPDVENYVSLLKSGQYDSFFLPDLNSSDIPTLLKYANDTTTITKFPMNGISSYMQMECSLGMIVLWTIESIRAVEIKSERLIAGFPSQNPFLQLKVPPFDWVFDDVSQMIAAKAYNEWWHSHHLFKDRMKTDPLKDTPYKWH